MEQSLTGQEVAFTLETTKKIAIREYGLQFQSGF